MLAMAIATARKIVSAVLASAKPRMSTLATLSIKTSSAKKQLSCDGLFLRNSPPSPVFAIEEANSWKTRSVQSVRTASREITFTTRCFCGCSSFPVWYIRIMSLRRMSVESRASRPVSHLQPDEQGLGHLRPQQFQNMCRCQDLMHSPLAGQLGTCTVAIPVGGPDKELEIEPTQELWFETQPQTVGARHRPYRHPCLE